MRMPHRLVAWWAKPALACSSLALIFAIAELGVRVRQYLRYGSFSEIGGSRKPDPATGLVIPEPGTSTASIRINTLGFRGPEIVRPKPARTLRLAFVGASTTFCAEVSSNEKTWPHLVWSQLQARTPDVALDYVNAGLPGVLTESSRVNFERRVGPLAPDVVVLYEGFNDVIADSRRLAAERGIPISKPEEHSGLASMSVFWRLVRKNVRLLEARALAASQRANIVLPTTQADRFADELGRLIDDAARIAPVVAVATLSSRLRADQGRDEELDAAEVALYYMPFLAPSEIRKAYELYNDAIRRVAREKNVLLIDGENAIPADSVHFRDTIHFADSGSERMAERVSGALAASTRYQRLLSGAH